MKTSKIHLDSAALPPNHIAVLRDGRWGIMDVSTQRYILSGWDKINGVYGDRYIVGKKKIK